MCPSTCLIYSSTTLCDVTNSGDKKYEFQTPSPHLPLAEVHAPRVLYRFVCFLLYLDPSRFGCLLPDEQSDSAKVVKTIT